MGADNTVYNDVWMFDLVRRRWEKGHSGGPISTPRTRHSAVVIDDSMYVFGGYGEANQENNDCCIYSFYSKLKSIFLLKLIFLPP